MFLKSIFMCSVAITVSALYAAPAKKISSTRVGQLEVEYRAALQPRRDQIIQELTSAGFGRIAQQLVTRYAPAKKPEPEITPQQEPQKSTQAATTVKQTEDERIAQAKEHAEKIKAYNTQFQQVQRDVKDIANAAKTMQDFDAMQKKIDDLAALKVQLQTEQGDIQALRALLQEQKNGFTQKEQKRQVKLTLSVNDAVETAKNAKNIDQINQARQKINAIEIQVNDYASDLHKKDFLNQLRDALSLLAKAENEFLQKGAEFEEQQQQQIKLNEQEKKEQETKIVIQAKIDIRDQQIKAGTTKEQAQDMVSEIELQLLALDAINLAKSDKDQFKKKLQDQKRILTEQ